MYQIWQVRYIHSEKKQADKIVIAKFYNNEEVEKLHEH